MVDEDLVLVDAKHGICNYKTMPCTYKDPSRFCTHPKHDDSGKNPPWHHDVCSRPSRIFIKRHDLPKYIAIKLIG